MRNEKEEPPNQIDSGNISDIMDTGTTCLPIDDIESKQGMGNFWDRFIQPILYPAGNSVCTRCIIIYKNIP